MTLFPWWNPTCSVFLLPFSAHTSLISVGSTTPSVSLLGILIPQRSSPQSNHRSFLVILGNFIFNQHAHLVLEVNVISLTKQCCVVYTLWMSVHEKIMPQRKKKQVIFSWRVIKFCLENENTKMKISDFTGFFLDAFLSVVYNAALGRESQRQSTTKRKKYEDLGGF